MFHLSLKSIVTKGNALCSVWLNKLKNTISNRQLFSSSADASAEMIISEMRPHLQNGMYILHRIWSKIGVPEDQNELRAGFVRHHLFVSLNEMIDKEEQAKAALIAKVETLRKEVERLTAELEWPVHKVNFNLM